MANTKDIKKRIKSTKSIEKITAAMKMTSTTKLKKYQQAAEMARPYSDKLTDMVRILSAGSGQMNNPLFEVREKKNALFIVIGAEGGLCGSYNANVIRKAEESVARNRAQGADIAVIPCGKKCAAYFRGKKDVEIPMSVGDLSRISFKKVEAVIDLVKARFENKEADAVYLIYSQFVSAMSQKPVVSKLLPMTPRHEGIIDSSRLTVDMIFEPGMNEILEALLPRYLNTVVFHAMMEALASEYGARMTAMTAANTNARDLLGELSLQYNKARQAIITNELIDIVNGVSGVK